MSETIEIKPNLSGFLSSFREIGYRLETAIADIVDNSISAGAKSVRISMLPSSKNVIVFDDGSGMSSDELVDAMRFGTQKDLREAWDLGKFGLGLKTASFSQTKKFAVISKKDRDISALQWDIAYMEKQNDWIAKKPNLDEIRSVISYVDKDIPKLMDNLSSWTVVVWEEMDKYSDMHLNELASILRDHLSLVFHRYMSKDGYNGKKVSLIFNGASLEPRNPFAETNLATQKNPTETIKVRGHDVRITAYDLPNHTKLTKQQYGALDMGEGFTKNQGFYLYREGRLLCWGTWFGLAKFCDATSLARIMIDTNNKQDELWNIDVKKSMAEPVPEVKHILKPYSLKTRSRSKSSKSHRGSKRATRTEWWIEERTDDGIITFRINRNHPLYIEIAESFGDTRTVLNEMFTKIETTLPIITIDAIMNQNPYSLKSEQTFDAESIRNLALHLKDMGRSIDKVFKLLSSDYDNNEYDDEIKKILDEVFS